MNGTELLVPHILERQHRDLEHHRLELSLTESYEDEASLMLGPPPDSDALGVVAPRGLGWLMVLPALARRFNRLAPGGAQERNCAPC